MDNTELINLASLTKGLNGNEPFVELTILEAWPSPDLMDSQIQKCKSQMVRAGIAPEFMPQTEKAWQDAATAHFKRTLNCTRILTVDEFIKAARYWTWCRTPSKCRPDDIRFMGVRDEVYAADLKEILTLWLAGEFTEMLIKDIKVSISKYKITFTFHGMESIIGLLYS